MTLRRLATALVLALVPFAVAAATAGAAAGKQRLPSLSFRGEATFPTGFQFAGTNVGGLSSITYDEARGAYHIISDDRSQLSPARFYTARIDLADGALGPGDVTFTGVTTLKQPDGSTFPIFSLDPEGMVLTDEGLAVTSEGDTGRLIPAFVRTFGLDGSSLRSFPVPSYFDPTTDGSSGIRGNLALEAAGVTPNGNFLYAGMEGALFQDGPAASLAGGSLARVLRYNLRSHKADKQYVYPVGPIVEPSVPAGQFAVNGLVEVLPLSQHSMLTMERSFSVGAGNTIRIYFADLRRASDVDRFASLAGQRYRPIEKTLLFDLDALGLTLDNVEGMTFGPTLPDGRRSLILVSDNNFDPLAFTQFLAFAYSD
jgi:3-phytase/alkaline phosphatase D